MVTSNSRGTQKSRLKPLTIRTPLRSNESITSWLVRASLNQGCDANTFVQYYWNNYRIWHADVDKGLTQFKEDIYEDMAILANTTSDCFEHNTLGYITQKLGLPQSDARGGQNWVLPLSKRSSASLLGYCYCRKCFEDDENAYLDLRWRFSFFVYCDKHKTSLLESCVSCGMPYQPNLLSADKRYLNRCHFCSAKLNRMLLTRAMEFPETYQFQKNAMSILDGKSVEMLGQSLSNNDWFELMIFYINIIRKATRDIENNHMFYRFLNYLDINIVSVNRGRPIFEGSRFDLPFDYLPFEERTKLMYFANLLAKVSVDKWLEACQENSVTQNSFHWSSKTVIPQAFKVVYNQLPSNPYRTKESKNSKVAIRNVQSVKVMWQRLQRKANMKGYYEKQITK